MLALSAIPPSLVGLPTAAAVDSPPVLVEPSKASWPLPELEAAASGGVQLIGSKSQRYDFEFLLPDGVVNGKPHWYLIRMDVRLRFDNRAKGEWSVLGEMNGYTGARLDFSVERGQAEVQSLSLLGGRRTRTTAASEVTESFVNYAQDGGLIPGKKNVLSFRIDTEGSVGLSSVEILPTSGIEFTTAQPTEIGLGTPGKPLVVAVGESVEIPFGITRRGGHPDAPIKVELSALASGISVVGESHQEFAEVGAGVRGKFVLKVDQAGEYRIGVRALGSYNPAGGEVNILAGPRGPSRVRWWLVIPVALVALTIGFRQMLRHVPRTRRRSNDFDG